MSFLKRLFSRAKKEITIFEDGNSVTNTKEMKVLRLGNTKVTIPFEIFNLLWFADTKHKNYDYPENNYSNDSISISFGTNMDIEPSVLISTLPVKNGKPEKLGYYPSYMKMNPEQRYGYLNWLSNGNQEPEDIGYVFTFYYGLERWLFTDKYEAAIKMIARLKKQTNNNSFQDYSNSGLVFAAIHHRYIEALNYINFDQLKPETYLLLKYMFNIKLNVDDLIKISKGVGFTNHRYIKNEPDMFSKILTNKLIERFDEPYYRIQVPEDYAYESMNLVPLANYSLNQSDREIEIGNILSYSPLKKELFNILQSTHDDVKQKLKDIRKQKRTQEKLKKSENT